MPSGDEVSAGNGVGKCQLIGQAQALRDFATHAEGTQSQRHIKPLHWYVACRLVIEGGFRPDEITPHPPLRATQKGGVWLLEYDESAATSGEQTILGGLKTKNVDVVANKPGIGPVLAVSCKGMTGAFRNLTNRMEETIGECTNLHITYPALVFGYMFVIRANRAGTESARALKPNDIAVSAEGLPVESIYRFHSALRELYGRRGIRNDVSRYEAVALALVEPTGAQAGAVTHSFPAEDSGLRLEGFFEKLYRQYDERYVFSAPDLKRTTARLHWANASPLFLQRDVAQLEFELGYAVRSE